MNYARIDHSNDLIHFTKDKNKWNYSESYKTFFKIVSEGFLKESSYLRLGNIPSICFTEASYMALTKDGKLNDKYFSRYSPFGFMFTKVYIFGMGGRPVIYSPDYEFERDNDKTNWRTVSYYPAGSKGGLYRDFTWEREWRIKPSKGTLKVDWGEVVLVFPSLAWAEKFRNDLHSKYDQEFNTKVPKDCKIVHYNPELSNEENEELKKDAELMPDFSWTLLNMNCNNIPEP